MNVVNSGVGAGVPAMSPASWGGRLLKSIGHTKKSMSNDSLPAEDSTFEVNLVDGETIIVNLDRIRQHFKYGEEILVQDVVKDICKTKEIAPNTAGFFGIKCEFSSGMSMWIVQTKNMKEIKQEKKKKFYFRLQFKVLCGQDLHKRDPNAYEYYLKQCRVDFKSGAFSKELEGKDNEKILLRIVILEMMMLYQEISSEEKLSQLKDMLKHKYKKYFSIDEILKKYYDRDGPRDMARCRQKVEKSLNCFAKVSEPDKDFMTEIELLRNYRDVVFYLQKYERGGTDANQVELWVSPKDVQKKVLISNVRTSLWEAPYSQLHQLKFQEVDKNKGIKMMIIRGDEPPEIMYCANEEMFESICSFIDGYFRLLVNQYNSLLYDSCEYLLQNPFFGPIHRDVAVQILSNKGNERGTYLIREHTSQYGRYVLSLISNEDEIHHIHITRQKEDDKKFYSICGSKQFQTVEDLTKHFSNTKNSEEIKGNLTLRIVPKHAGNIPLYINPANLRPIIDRPFSKLSHSSLKSRCQVVMIDPSEMKLKKHINNAGTFGEVSIYSLRDGRELLVKKLNTIKPEELLNLYDVLKSTQHESIVPLVGISLINDLFLAHEYLELGSLDMYLLDNRSVITYGALLKYLMQITEAIEFLHSQDYIHADLSIGNIYVHNANHIKVGDGCIKWKMSTVKSVSEVIFSKRFNFHAPEIITNENKMFTKKSDVWSYGLTIWQLFTLEKPFRNNTSDQLKDFFNQHNHQVNKQAPLLHLNMYSLPHCTDELFKLLNGCLEMQPENRLSMEKVKFHANNSIIQKTPTKDKQKFYFTFDWNAESQSPPVEIPHQNQNINAKKESIVSDNGSYTSASSLMMKRSDSINSNTTVPPVNLSIVKNEETDMDTSFTDISPKLMEGENFCGKVVNGSSQSAPSSPTRPKLYRSNSLNEASKRGEDELATASILVDMSQTKYPQQEKLKRSMSMSTAVKPEINPSMQSTCMLTGSPIRLPLTEQSSIPLPLKEHTSPQLNSNEQNSHLTLNGYNPRLSSNEQTSRLPLNERTPRLPLNEHTHLPLNNYNSPYIAERDFIKGIWTSSTNRAILPKESPESLRFQQQQQPPPDSPEAVRREFATEHMKRDLPRNDRTRLYLQERINKERDRFHGKRSLSFTEEFDEYKNNTIRAAKRALLGPNPFNIGVQLPEDFLLRTDKRLYQTSPALPRDVTRYFKNVNIEATESPKYSSDSGGQNNPILEQYKTMKDLETIRNNTLNTDGKPDSNDPPAEVQYITKSMEIMHAHSPTPASSEDKINFTSEQSMSITNENTRPPLIVHSSMPEYRAISQSMHNSQPTVCFPFNPSILHTRSHGESSIIPLVSTETTKPLSRNLKDLKFLPAYPNIPYPNPVNRTSQVGVQVSLARISNPVAVSPFYPMNSPQHFISRTLPIQPNPQQLPIQPNPRMLQGSTHTLPTTTHILPGPTHILPRPRHTNIDFITNRPIAIRPIFPANPKPAPVISSLRNIQREHADTDMYMDHKQFHDVQQPGYGIEFRKINNSELVRKEMIGKGEFGEVWKGVWMYTKSNTTTATPIHVAIKKIISTNASPEEKKKNEDDIRKEAKHLANLSNDQSDKRSQHIIKLYGLCTDDNDFQIVQEYATYGRIDCHISKDNIKSHLKPGDILNYCKQVAVGMDYIHSKKVIHRDLACRNILVVFNDLIKISDLGMGRQTMKEYYRQTPGNKMPIGWCAIESIGEGKFSQETDYWGFGVTAWEMYTVFSKDYRERTATPYKEIESQYLYHHLEAGHRLPKPSSCPDLLWEHIKSCWDRDPKQRPTFTKFISLLNKIMKDIGYET